MTTRSILYQQSKLLAKKRGIKPPTYRTSTIVSLNEFITESERRLNYSQTLKNELKRNITARVFRKLMSEGKYQEIFNYVISGVSRIKNSGGNPLIKAEATELINHFTRGGRFNLQISYNVIDSGNQNNRNDVHNIAISNSTRDWLIEFLMNPNNNEISEIPAIGSDTLTNLRFRSITSMVLSEFVSNRVIRNRDGAFFDYVNTTKLDLSRYQIFNQEQINNKQVKINQEQCLFTCLLLSGVNKADINTLKLSYVKGNSIRKSDIKDIAKTIKRTINVYSIKPDESIKKSTYKCEVMSNHNEQSEINITIFENHYFLYEECNYSKFYINHYGEIEKQSIKNANIITEYEIKNGKKYYRKCKNYTKINSLQLVQSLFKQGYFVKMDMTTFNEFNTNKLEINEIYLENIEKEQSIINIFNSNGVRIKGDSLGEPGDNIIYADNESFVSNADRVHRLYLLGYCKKSDVDDKVNILNVCDFKNEQFLINEFMADITKCATISALVYYHNLKYDYHLLEKFINIQSRCEKDGNLYSVKATYIFNKRKVYVEFRDSYKIIPFALQKFTKEFNLDKKYHKKEAIAYEYYTRENNNVMIKKEIYEDFLSYEDREIYNTEVKNYINRDGLFNPTKYYMDYLKLDCLVLKKGLEKFAKIIEELTELNLYASLTISSLTNKYMESQGAYDGVYSITGNLREYVSRAIYGGRVCVNEKFKKKVIEGKISDYDGVSLYPSSINRLCREMGLPTGKCMRYTNLDIQHWKIRDYSIMTVKITKVNKRQNMPFIAIKNGEESIKYTNDIKEGGEILIIDSITLEDYIKFHEIEYELIDGVYWDEGYNKRMGEVVNRLFNTRLEYKTSNPALANVIKLMLNSAYGKTIMKKTHSEKKIVSYKVDNYICNNFNTIKSFRKLNDNNYEIERVCADKSFNRGHVGCAILSMSKRIMNEVFDIANSNDINIYYTDTDSIHTDFDKVKLLENKYRETYNKELNGKQLEQFHTDFELKGAVEHVDIYATKSIFLGKKSYLDVLESKDEDDNVIMGYHIRLKGITTEGIEHAAKNYKDSYFGLYYDMANDKEIDMLLNPFNYDTNKRKVLFEFENGQVSTKQEFIRKVCFKKKIKD